MQPDQFVILNLWHDSLKERDGQIVCPHNYRHYANEQRQRGEKVQWIKRGEAVDQAVRFAAEAALPVRVIVNLGKHGSGGKASQVSLRELDPEPWHVDQYDDATGAFVLVRGARTSRFVDQFDLKAEELGPAERRQTTSNSRVRKRDVRVKALKRANGVCEHCGEAGFMMADDRIYLETHHIVSLSADGPDHVSNVIALCPNHHREAHHGAGRSRLQKEFQSRIRQIQAR